MGKTILVADDSRTIQKVVELTFHKTEFSVLSVSDGREALTLAADKQPDVVLADIGMPGTDGYQVCSALKSRPDTRSIAVILLASAIEGLDRSRAEDAHADAHIDKPFDTQELITLVKQMTGVAIDSSLPMSFAATLAQRRGENNPSDSNAAVLPNYAADHAAKETEAASPASPPPTDEVVIEESDPIELEVVPAGPFLEPPTPPDAQPPTAANVDVWALADGGGSEATPPAAQEVSFDDAEPIPVEDLHEQTPSSALVQEIAGQAAAPAAEAVHNLIPELPRDDLTRIAREVLEKVAWEVVPELAETIIREEIDRLLADD